MTRIHEFALNMFTFFYTFQHCTSLSEGLDVTVCKVKLSLSTAAVLGRCPSQCNYSSWTPSSRHDVLEPRLKVKHLILRHFRLQDHECPSCAKPYISTWYPKHVSKCPQPTGAIRGWTWTWFSPLIQTFPDHIYDWLSATNRKSRTESHITSQNLSQNITFIELPHTSISAFENATVWIFPVCPVKQLSRYIPCFVSFSLFSCSALLAGCLCSSLCFLMVHTRIE